MPKHIRFYTSERLGEKRSFTPEGYLLCESVPIARVGTLLYAEGEVPIDANADGIIRIHRDPEEVFKPSAVLSFSGKSVTNDHPPEKVVPEVWRTYTKGTVLHPHRGDGVLEDDDFLYADLLIYDPETIQDVLDGKREVSAGYEADYEQIQPGEGRQNQIIGNHVALVSKGRCGPRCAIGDKAMPDRLSRAAFRDRIMRAARTGDETMIVKEVEKISDMLGDIISDEAPPNLGGGGSDPRHITINVHGSGSGGTAHAPAVHDEGEAPPFDDGDDDDGDDDDQMSQILARLERIENALVVLAQAEKDEVDEGDDDDDDDSGFDEAEGTGSDEGDESHDDADEIEGEEKKWPHGDPGEVEREGGTRDARRRARMPGMPSKTPRHMRMATDHAAPRAMVGDSTSLRTEFAETMSRGELLVPGVKLLTFDTKSQARMTVDGLCKFRRNVLRTAWRHQETHDVISAMTGDTQMPNFDSMTCDQARLIFNGASEAVRNRGMRIVPTRDNGGKFGAVPNNADINKANLEYYKQNGGLARAH